MRLNRLPLFAVIFLQLARGAFAGQAARTDPSGPFDLQSYTSQLERWSVSAGRLPEHPAEAPALRARLPDSLTVIVQEQRFLVSTRPLEAALDQFIRDPHSAAAATQDLSSHIESMLRDARAVSMPSVRDSNGTRAKLDDILKRREFRSPREPSESNAFWDRLVDRLWMWLGKILIRASGHPGAFNFLLWGIVVVLGVIFLLWLLYTCTHLSYTRLPTPTRRQGSIATWMEWMQQARAAAARGEHREAIRMIYAAAVCRLGEKGVWQVDPSRTHREYVRLLPADSAHRPPLMGIATCFEQVWYGHAQASAHDYEAALTELESLE